MVPMPIDGLQTPLPPGMQSSGSPSGGSISLAVLLDFILQRTYHELTVLAELLPRKTDMERKIEIVQFANRTRQLFVRLLALVKWANSASKVDKCTSIMGFLDKQSMLFVETADLMSRMARETLVHARLPNFQLPCAVEVLTTGSYVRLPTCIRDRILFHDPITPQERQSTLQRLEQIIQHRLVTSVDLPPQMRKLRIENGRVTFHVEQEFEVSLTLMGDTPNIPWRLLDIVFLVEDKETGDGRSLVHPLQIRYIIDLAQSRLLDNPTPLFDLYNCLHSFSQSLQLEVLYSQVYRLCRERLGEFIRVDEYVPGKCLSVAFWRELTEKSGQDYKLCVQIDPQDNGRPLQLIHSPSLASQSPQNADQAIKSDLLSFERLLVQTIYIRTKQRLNELKEEIKVLLNWEIDSAVSGSPAVLNIPILQPCLRSEQLLITVDTHLGIFLAHVPQYAQAPYVDDIRQTLNTDRSRFCKLVSELKFWIVLQRCRKSVQHLPVLSIDRLPILHPPDHPIALLSRHKLFIKLCKHAGSFLVVELKEKVGNPFEVEEIFYLLAVNSSTYEEAGGDSLASNMPATSSAPVSSTASPAGGSNINMNGHGMNVPTTTSGPGTSVSALSGVDGTVRIKTESDQIDVSTPKLFYTVKSLVQFDTFAVTHGPFTRVDSGDTASELCRTLTFGKRKFGALGSSGRLLPDMQHPGHIGGSGISTANKRPKHPAYFLPNLAHVVAMADERIPFAALAEELTARGLCHQGLQVEAGGAGLALRLVQMPPCKGLDGEVSQALQMALLGCTIRMQGRVSRAWLVEYAFCKCPLVSVAAKEQGPRRQVYFIYDVAAANSCSKTVDDLIDDWNAIAYLYGTVLGYVQALNQDAHGGLATIADVKSYSYKRLILGYGPNRSNTVSVSWRSSERRFSLAFGVIGPTASAVNPHTLTAAQLQHHFNRNKSVPSLLHLLKDTYLPLTSVAKLTTSPMLAVLYSRPQVPLQTFTVIPRSPTHFRVSFRNSYCLDIHCRGEGIVAVRDGAYSLFDKSKAIEEFTPTQGLKAFLNKFVDDSVNHSRRRSQSEDDNPPSPVSAVDSLDGFMGGHPKPGSPAQRSQDVSGLRFHHPTTPSSGSNPHTPASPHASVVLPYGSSPAAASSFSLASPPSLPHNINPSPSLHMGTPSPGGLLSSNSPGNPLHVPSPSSFMPQPSPSGPPVHLQSPAPYVGGSSHSHDAGSPYPGGAGSGGSSSVPGNTQVGTPGSSGLSIASPATQWPGSPSIPRPSPAGRGFGSAQSPGGHPALHSPQNVGGEHGKSGAYSASYYLRVLPQRSWAAAVPTLLSEGAFDVLCTPVPPPGGPIMQGTSNVHCSPLERFLGCVYIRRNLLRFIQSEDCLCAMPCNEVGVVAFKVETLQCRVTLNSVNFHTMLHIKMTPTPEYMDKWNLEEIQVLERFFETKVVCSPYKPNALLAFARILNAPSRILKDCIQIMRLEMIGDRNMKWAVQWCLTIPPAAPPIAPAGMAAVVIAKNKLLFFIQLTRIGLNFAPGTEPQTVVLPIVYDITSNSTQLADRQQGNVPPTSATAIISNILKRFADFNPKPGECSIFPAVRELMANLVIPQ